MTPDVAIVGPTASGKSELAVAVAHRLSGEVVNTDSMQLYIGMDIGTAKLPESEREGVPHHLLDVWPVTYTATLAEFQQLALNAMADIRKRAKRAILVGGSGMYIQAVVDRWKIPGTDPAVRTQLEAELHAEGAQHLHDRLTAVDPQAAAAILPSNGRRLVRALEVVALEGTFAARLPQPAAASDVVLVGLEVPRDELDVRITDRVDRMWEKGLVAEVRSLVDAGLSRGVTARRALGYAQVLRMLAGECTEEEARLDTVAATRRFARKQQSWFRRDPRVQWLRYDRTDLLDQVMEVVGR